MKPLTKVVKLTTAIALMCSLTLSVFSSTANASMSMQADVDDQQQQSITESLENQRYGNWLFKGGFKGQSFSAINPEYRISQGDNLLIQLWGGIDHQAEITVDAQGNIFIPKVGPIKVLGVKNADLNEVIFKSVKRVYKSNVEVYVSLVSSQKVKIFLSGMVVKPGLYEGQSADSVLRFIDQAGGIRDDLGSYRNIQVKRNNKSKYKIDLYEFLQSGNMPAIQLQDGDVVFVGAKQAEVTLEGDLGFAGRYELSRNKQGQLENLSQVLAAVVANKDATHATVIAPDSNRGPNITSSGISASSDSASNMSNSSQVREVTAKQYLIEQAPKVNLQAGSLIKITSQLRATSISVELLGEHNSAKEMVVPWGSSVADLLEQMEFSALSNTGAIQLYRESVAKRQAEMLQASLSSLEQSVLTARSETKEAALLRQAEADIILQWVAKARQQTPKGQVLLSEGYDASKIILSQGDKLVIPAKRNLIMVHGEVMFPTAITYQDGMSINDFINNSGGATRDLSDMNILVMKPNGSFIDMNGQLKKDSVINPGDEIFVLAKPDFKGFQLTKDITQLIYQLAMSTAVVLAL